MGRPSQSAATSMSTVSRNPTRGEGKEGRGGRGGRGGGRGGRGGAGVSRVGGGVVKEPVDVMTKPHIAAWVEDGIRVVVLQPGVYYVPLAQYSYLPRIMIVVSPLRPFLCDVILRVRTETLFTFSRSMTVTAQTSKSTPEKSTLHNPLEVNFSTHLLTKKVVRLSAFSSSYVEMCASRTVILVLPISSRACSQL